MPRSLPLESVSLLVVAVFCISGGVQAQGISQPALAAKVNRTFQEAQAFDVTGQIDVAEADYRKCIRYWGQPKPPAESPERKKILFCQRRIAALETLRGALPAPRPAVLPWASYRCNGQQVYIDPLGTLARGPL